jgi:hypothetical protein
MNNQKRMEYKRMAQYLQSEEGQKNMVRSIAEGVEKARNVS